MSSEKDVKEYTDNFGLLCKKWPTFLEGGDTCANEFTVQYVKAYYNETSLAEMRQKLILLTTYNGIPIRHPDGTKWYANEKCTSADQVVPYLCFLAATAHEKKVVPYYRSLSLKAFAGRGFLFAWNVIKNGVYEFKATHNKGYAAGYVMNDWPYGDDLVAREKVPDFMFFKVAHLWIRACRVWALYPVLCVLDLYLLANVAVKYLGSKIDPDQRNAALSIHCAANYMPTPASLIAHWLYSRLKPRQYFKAFWADDANEPPIDTYMNRLYKD